MTDDTASTGDDAAARADIAALQEQLKTVTAERDRNLFEKNEIINKANAASRERDDARAKLAETGVERDRLAAEKAEAARKAEETARRLDEAQAEVARLRGVIDAAPSADPAVLLWQLIRQRTKACVAWTRSKIPADSPMLPWFDRTVETVTKLGCLAIQTTDKFIRWALPRLIDLGKRLISEVEARLAKK
jgi:hypothetical protein